ncbi:MAG: RNA polymerase sigma factor [Saprospiraceae bacterium]|nr:RNA polymerase sigma factor [Saprospiraceae bacterium]
MIYPDDSQILEFMISPSKRNEGYRYLVGKYKEKLYWHIRRLVGDHEDADDVLQNTFIKIVRNIDGFQKQSSLYTWIYKIATNESLNFIQTKKNKYAESLDGSQVEYIKDSVYFDENKALDHLQTAINRLPEKQKLVFNLRYYDEMPYQDMADITDTSVGALKASYHHAVKKIEEHLKATI